MKRLGGVIPALPTPLKSSEDIDVASFCKLIDHVIGQGASAVFVFGGMGEGPALLNSEKAKALPQLAKHIAGRVPLLVGIAEPSTRRAMELGRMLEGSADALVATAPFYYKFPHPDSMLDHLASICDAVTPPVIFYNAPGATGNSVSAETLIAIMEMPKIVAVKDSSANFGSMMKLLRHFPNPDNRPAALLEGDEMVYDASLMMGVDGIVTGAGTCFVDVLVRLVDAAKRGQRAEAFRVQQEFLRGWSEVVGEDLPIDWVASIKGTLAERGLIPQTPTQPFLVRHIVD